MVSLTDDHPRQNAMSISEAKGQIERRMRLRFDGRSLSWSVQDAEAARLLLAHIGQLERRLRLK